MQKSEKADFQEYLNKKGVVEMLSSMLVNLYECPTRPDDAQAWVKEYFAGDMLAELKKQNEDLHDKKSVIVEKEENVEENVEKKEEVPKEE